MAFPEGIELYRDSGFQGHELANGTIHQPKKKPRNGQLFDEDKTTNRRISSTRVVIEHIISGIKRCRIVKDVFRNTKEGFDDSVIELACGLHTTEASLKTSVIEYLFNYKHVSDNV